MHPATNKCLEISADTRKVEVFPCDVNQQRQKWLWKDVLPDIVSQFNKYKNGDTEQANHLDIKTLTLKDKNKNWPPGHDLDIVTRLADGPG